MLINNSPATQLLQQDDGVYVAAAARHALPIAVVHQRTLAQNKAPIPRGGQRAALTDVKLKSLKPTNKLQKVADRDGMYVAITPGGVKSFRYDYRIGGRRETLVIGRYDETLGAKSTRQLDQLSYGISMSLAEARVLLADARRGVEVGISPSRAKAESRDQLSENLTFGKWTESYFAFKADPKSGDEQLADSTLQLRRSNYRRLLQDQLGERQMDGIKAAELSKLFDKIKAERGPGPAVHARELVLLVYRYAIGKGTELANPAEAIARNTIATFVPRERNLNRREIKVFFDNLQETGTAASLRLAVKFMLLTMVRKGEFIGATWKEIHWDRATWTIPRDRMKADKEHVVFLSDQALDILETLRALYPTSSYLHPSRYDSGEPISNATLNRTIDAAVQRINAKQPSEVDAFKAFSVHDLRRTASTRLNEALFPEALIEACLAHSKKDQVAAAYNHAKLPGPRRALLQGWADMVDCWNRGESAKDVIAATKQKIEEAAHSDAEMDL
jgi:integrase